MPLLELQQLVRRIATPDCNKLEIITTVVEFVRFEQHAQILYASDEVCAFVIECCFSSEGDDASSSSLRELGLESLWNIVHSNGDKRRLLTLDEELMCHLIRLASQPSTTPSALGNALGTLLEFSLDEEVCGEDIFAHRELLLRLVSSEDEETSTSSPNNNNELITGLALQILGNVMCHSRERQDVLFGHLFPQVVRCIHQGIRAEEVSLRLVALALWTLLMLLRQDTASIVFHCQDSSSSSVPLLVLLVECAELGTIRIQEKAICALCAFTDVPQLAEEICLRGDNDNITTRILDVFTTALERGRMTSIRDMALHALGNLCPLSPRVALYLRQRTRLLLDLMGSSSPLLRAASMRALVRCLEKEDDDGDGDDRLREQVVAWLCREDYRCRPAETWPRDVLRALDPQYRHLVQHLVVPQGHTHYSWWAATSRRAPQGHTSFSW